MVLNLGSGGIAIVSLHFFPLQSGAAPVFSVESELRQVWLPLDNLDLLDVLGSGLLSLWVWTRFPKSLPIELDPGFLSSRRPSAAKEPLPGEADFTTLGRSLPGETG